MPETIESFQWKLLRVGSLRECLDAWHASAAYQMLDDACRNASVLAIDELGSNFLRFSGPAAQVMFLNFGVDKKELTMKFEDDGVPFDPGSILPPPRANIALLPVGGRGLHMVRQATDSWIYRHENKQNKSTLKKKRAVDPLAEPEPEPQPEASTITQP